MKIAMDKIPGTAQETSEYAKKGDAKATIAEAKALAWAAHAETMIVVRFTFGLSILAFLFGAAALVVALAKGN